MLQNIKYNPSNGSLVFAIFIVGIHLYYKAITIVLCIVKTSFQGDFSTCRVNFERYFMFLDAVSNSFGSTAMNFKFCSCGANVVGFFDLKDVLLFFESQFSWQTI